MSNWNGLGGVRMLHQETLMNGSKKCLAIEIDIPNKLPLEKHAITPRRPILAKARPPGS
jgi:hypothetical protein